MTVIRAAGSLLLNPFAQTATLLCSTCVKHFQKWFSWQSSTKTVPKTYIKNVFESDPTLWYILLMHFLKDYLFSPEEASVLVYLLKCLTSKGTKQAQYWSEQWIKRRIILLSVYIHHFPTILFFFDWTVDCPATLKLQHCSGLAFVNIDVHSSIVGTLRCVCVCVCIHNCLSLSSVLVGGLDVQWLLLKAIFASCSVFFYKVYTP